MLRRLMSGRGSRSVGRAAYLIWIVAMLFACQLERSPIKSASVLVADADATGLADAGADVGPAQAGDAGGEEDASHGSGSTRMDASSLPRDAGFDAQQADADAVAQVDAGPGDDAGGEPDDDAGPREPTESFGQSCGAILCPSVTLPATQCCTGQGDVDARRARIADRCGIARADVPGCAQLEQLGLLDPSCPAVMPQGASLQEPGCCTDQGRCGTLDVEHDIGCHENPGVDQACGEDEVDPGETCEPTGVFAIRARVDVAWGGQTGGLFEITEDGRGTIEVVLHARIEQVDADNAFVARVRACGTRLPPFRSAALCEAYEPVFPDAIWDQGQTPEFGVSGRYQCTNPGCSVTFDPTTALVGIELHDPEAAWPSASQATTFECASGSGTDCYPDHDLDGRPGVTVLLPDGDPLAGNGNTCRDGYERRAAPLDDNLFAIVDGVARTDRLQLGVRLRLGASGRLSDDCASGQGQGIAEFVQSRAAGCMVQEGTSPPFRPGAGPNDPCNAAQGEFMNENLPVYDILRVGQRPSWRLSLNDRSPSQGPLYEIVRLGAADFDASCAEVRAAFE